MHDNKYIRYFSGHSERVTGLCLSPKTDMFLSAAMVLVHPSTPMHKLAVCSCPKFNDLIAVLVYVTLIV